MSNKNFKNQNYRNYNQYANKPEPEQVKEEIVEEIIEPAEETVEEVTEVEETVEEVTEVEDTVEEVTEVEDTVEEITEAEEETTEVTFGKVNCSKLNVRKGPSIHSNPLCIVEHGTSMEIGEFNDEWIKVLTPDGVSGYCMRKFIDLD